MCCHCVLSFRVRRRGARAQWLPATLRNRRSCLKEPSDLFIQPRNRSPNLLKFSFHGFRCDGTLARGVGVPFRYLSYSNFTKAGPALSGVAQASAEVTIDVYHADPVANPDVYLVQAGDTLTVPAATGRNTPCVCLDPGPCLAGGFHLFN
jgi:hypothetical protein